MLSLQPGGVHLKYFKLYNLVKFIVWVRKYHVAKIYGLTNLSFGVSNQWKNVFEQIILMCEHRYVDMYVNVVSLNCDLWFCHFSRTFIPRDKEDK